MKPKSVAVGSRSTCGADERCALKAGYPADPLRRLSPSELQAFWHRISVTAERDRLPYKILRLALRLGGQSIGELIRALSSDINWDAETLCFTRLIGSRRDPKQYLLPLGHLAKIEVETLLDHRQAMAVSERMVLTALRELRVELMSEAKWSRPYSVVDLQRTALDSISLLGVTREECRLLRGQSVRGVAMKRFWDLHYLFEKREALQKWEAYLEYLAVEPTITGSLRELVLAEPTFLTPRGTAAWML